MNQALAVTYHYVRERSAGVPGGIRPLWRDEFEQQLDWLSERYDIVHPDAFLAGVGAGDRPPCLLTFDDGTRDHLEVVAPILSERGLSGVFFVLTWPLEERRMPLTHAVHWVLGENERQVWEKFGGDEAEGPVLVLWLTSFGYKHGIPYGTDLLFDVRFLNNPHFEPELRDLTGREEGVVAFLRRDGEFDELVARLKDFLVYLLPRYRRERRSYLSVSIGCTGGRHRSVAVCEDLARELSDSGLPSRVDHRDIERGP